MLAYFLCLGDTLYSTSGELIDWYVGGSSVNQMAQSVRRLYNLITDKEVGILLAMFFLICSCLFANVSLSVGLDLFIC